MLISFLSQMRGDLSQTPRGMDFDTEARSLPNKILVKLSLNLLNTAIGDGNLCFHTVSEL